MIRFLALTVALTVISFSSNSFGRETNGEVIYGEDNRSDVAEAPSFYMELARSTAAMVKKKDLLPMTQNAESAEFSLEGKKFSELVCEDEKFSNQLVAATCSGFLVAPDILVTAGHCVRNQASCDENVWLFDYRSDLLGEGEKPTVSSKNVYRCQSIIDQKLDHVSKEDFAVIKLDRPVKDRAPLEIRKSGKVEEAAPMVVIGHPSGLPTKVTDGAHVRTNDDNVYFVINADTFGGNSGSPVFHGDSGIVEGILVRGERDFDYDFEKKCRVVNRCKDDECRGEDVTRITLIDALKKL